MGLPTNAFSQPFSSEGKNVAGGAAFGGPLGGIVNATDSSQGGGDPWSGDWKRKYANMFHGTSDNPGWAGVGYYDPERAAIDEGAFTDNTQSNALRDQFAQQLAAAQARGANFGDEGQGADREQQLQAIQALQAQARGEGPSVAQSQLAQATNQNISQQMGMAGAGRGNPALAQRAAEQNIAALNQQQAAQSGQLRAQEMQSAQQQLGGALSNLRSTDIGLARAKAENAMQQQQQNDAMARYYQSDIGDLNAQQKAQAIDLAKMRTSNEQMYQNMKAQAYYNTSKSRANLMGNFGGGLGFLSGKMGGGTNTGGGTTTGGGGTMAGGGESPLGAGESFAAGGGVIGDEKSPRLAIDDEFNSGGGRALEKSLQSNYSVPSGQDNSNDDAGGGMLSSGLVGGILSLLAHGGKVPGIAPHPGVDTQKNDVVDARLSPGEGVIPLSAMASEKEFDKFVNALKAYQISKGEMETAIKHHAAKKRSA